jgi:hypothetical protein
MTGVESHLDARLSPADEMGLMRWLEGEEQEDVSGACLRACTITVRAPAPARTCQALAVSGKSNSDPISNAVSNLVLLFMLSPFDALE